MDILLKTFELRSLQALKLLLVLKGLNNELLALVNRYEFVYADFEGVHCDFNEGPFFFFGRR